MTRPPVLDNPPQPGDLVFFVVTRSTERRQLEVRVRIDKPRHDRHVAEVQIARAFARRAHPGNSPVLDRQAAILDRWTLDRIDKPGRDRERAASHRQPPRAKARESKGAVSSLGGFLAMKGPDADQPAGWANPLTLPASRWR